MAGQAPFNPAAVFKHIMAYDFFVPGSDGFIFSIAKCIVNELADPRPPPNRNNTTRCPALFGEWGGGDRGIGGIE